MKNLIQQVINWAEESNLVNPVDIQPETLVLIAKFGKLSQAISKGSNCREEIGNCLINLIIICRMKNFSLADCLDYPLKQKDERFNDPLYILAVILTCLGQISENIGKNKEFKEELCHLLTYLAMLTSIPNISLLDCLDYSFNKIKKMRIIKFNGIILTDADEDFSTALMMLKGREENMKE